MAWFHPETMVRAANACRCFQVWGKAEQELQWRVIDVYATPRRNADSSWPSPFWRGTCITWGSELIEVGWDFARLVLQEQAQEPASRQRPVFVAGGRLRNRIRRDAVGAMSIPTASEVLAHECGHTWQAATMGPAYWAVGATFTLLREGSRSWNWFENQASEQGRFGGIVNQTVTMRG